MLVVRFRPGKASLKCPVNSCYECSQGTNTIFHSNIKIVFVVNLSELFFIAASRFLALEETYLSAFNFLQAMY